MAIDKTVYLNFRNAFEQKCFRLINDAYQTCLTENIIQLEWNENDISYQLCEIIDRNPRRIEKYKIHISPEYRLYKPGSKEKGFADKMPRVDFRMSHFSLNQEFKYYFEAKRLRENDSKLKRAYISEGMDRFISSKYPIGCMLGYLLEGRVNETVNGINALLVKDKRKTEILERKVNNLLESYYESNHIEIGTLKHFILKFTDISN